MAKICILGLDFATDNSRVESDPVGGWSLSFLLVIPFAVDIYVIP